MYHFGCEYISANNQFSVFNLNTRFFFTCPKLPDLQHIWKTCKLFHIECEINPCLKKYHFGCEYISANNQFSLFNLNIRFFFTCPKLPDLQHIWKSCKLFHIYCEINPCLKLYHFGCEYISANIQFSLFNLNIRFFFTCLKLPDLQHIWKSCKLFHI